MGGGWFSPAWELALSAIIPAALAILILLAEQRGPLAAPIQACKGLVPAYVPAIAVVFGLFAALLASDAWQKDTLARRILGDEVDAARVIAQFSRAAGIEGQVMPRLKAYLEASSKEKHYTPTAEASRTVTEKAYEELLAVVLRTPLADSSRPTLVKGASDLKRAHDDRFYLAADRTVPIKWLSIVIFGALTQIALMLAHVGQRHHMRVVVGLFTVTFSACLIVVSIFDTPFDRILFDEPAASIGEVLKAL
jgi:hypothetical protein